MYQIQGRIPGCPTPLCRSFQRRLAILQGFSPETRTAMTKVSPIVFKSQVWLNSQLSIKCHCWLNIKPFDTVVSALYLEQWKQVRFLQTHNQGLHTKNKGQNSYKGFNQNQGKKGGIIHCCASLCFCFDLWRKCTLQTIALISVIFFVWVLMEWKSPTLHFILVKSREKARFFKVQVFLWDGEWLCITQIIWFYDWFSAPEQSPS